MDPIESLSEDPISRLGPLPMHRVGVSATVQDAVTIMQTERTGCVLVVENDYPVGILTERDVLRHMSAVGSLETPIVDVASKTLWTVRSTDAVAFALRVMNERHCRRLPVVDDDGRAAGVLSVRRIIRALVDHFPSSVYNLPPTANQVPKDREGA